MIRQLYILLTLFFLQPTILFGAEFPLVFTDSIGQEITLTKQPSRVVSLVPSTTEIMQRIGAVGALVGQTLHSNVDGVEIVGGFFSPNLDMVAGLNPDLIFYSDIQKGVVPRFKGKAILVQLSPHTISEGFADIALLGRIFKRQQQATAIITEQQRQLDLIAEKVGKIPAVKKKRVIRLMGRKTLMAPGDDSFQNEYIRAAGGIAPTFGKDGAIISVELDQWQGFNPEVLYGCGGERDGLALLQEPGWRDVDGVKNNRRLYFPCELTCRLSTHPGSFVSWLSAQIYREEFGNSENIVLPEQVVGRRVLALDLASVERAEIVESDIKDFRNKTLVLTFKQPMTIVSTLEGQRDNIRTVANHYFPPPAWGLGHGQGLQGLRDTTLRVLELDAAATSILFTGADMDNLAVVTKSFKDMKVTALVTAGVQGNALRMSRDTGRFYEPDQVGQSKKPGTINIILLSNMQLSPRAMTRALITATEGKSAALQDMDIRSSPSRQINQATGTGTDNIIVVQGTGVAIDASGGHSKMGELIASAVHDGVQQAIGLQNGLSVSRSVFQRLKERRIDLSSLCRKIAGAHGVAVARQELEGLLLQPRYADFLKGIMAMSDAYEKGLITDLSSIDLWCQNVAGDIAGQPVTIKPIVAKEVPAVLAKGLDALLNGVRVKLQ